MSLTSVDEFSQPEGVLDGVAVLVIVEVDKDVGIL